VIDEHTFGPCQPWPVLWQNCAELTTSGPAVTGQAVQAATEILWALSGRRFGPCPVTIRPCQAGCADLPASWVQVPIAGVTWPTPVLYGGAWYNLTCAGCGATCSCTELSEARLPAPATVLEVRLDGAVLPAGAWRVDDWRLLVRTDGGRWPACQDLTAPDSEPGTWAVDLEVGEPVGELGQFAVGELACELLRAFRGEDCRLPANVTSLARQGVSIELPSPALLREQGLLGLPWCDRFIQAANPHRLLARSRTFSVDHPPWRVTSQGGM
jgi:hypothetical protein